MEQNDGVVNDLAERMARYHNQTQIESILHHAMMVTATSKDPEEVHAMTATVNAAMQALNNQEGKVGRGYTYYEGGAVLINSAGNEVPAQVRYALHGAPAPRPALVPWSGHFKLPGGETLDGFAIPGHELLLRLDDRRQAKVILQEGNAFTGVGRLPE